MRSSGLNLTDCNCRFPAICHWERTSVPFADSGSIHTANRSIFSIISASSQSSQHLPNHLSKFHGTQQELHIRLNTRLKTTSAHEYLQGTVPANANTASLTIDSGAPSFSINQHPTLQDVGPAYNYEVNFADFDTPIPMPPSNQPKPSSVAHSSVPAYIGHTIPSAVAAVSHPPPVLINTIYNKTKQLTRHPFVPFKNPQAFTVPRWYVDKQIKDRQMNSFPRCAFLESQNIQSARVIKRLSNAMELELGKTSWTEQQVSGLQHGEVVHSLTSPLRSRFLDPALLQHTFIGIHFISYATFCNSLHIAPT